MSTEITLPQPGEVTRFAMGEVEARVRAEVQARITVAKMSPRHEENARARILHDCERSAFAERAIYRRPVGKKFNEETKKWEQQFADGFSIRFTEMAIQRWGNVWNDSPRILGEDDRRALIQVQVFDLENVIGYSREAIVEKLVERKNASGRRELGRRMNSFGDPVVLVEATADEFRTKLAAEASKMLRDNQRRLLPADLLDEARARIDAAIAAGVDLDPDAARKKILDSFYAVGVMPDQLHAYLERPIEALRPADLAELRVLYNALKEGDCTWADIMRIKDAPAEGESNAASGAPSPARNVRSDKLRKDILGARGAGSTTTPDSGSAPPSTGG